MGNGLTRTPPGSAHVIGCAGVTVITGRRVVGEDAANLRSTTVVGTAIAIIADQGSALAQPVYARLVEGAGILVLAGAATTTTTVRTTRFARTIRFADADPVDADLGHPLVYAGGPVLGESGATASIWLAGIDGAVIAVIANSCGPRMTPSGLADVPVSARVAVIAGS